MSTPDRRRYQNRLDDLFTRVGSVSEHDEIRAHWARYLCVLCSGYVEVAVREILGEYARRTASPEIRRFVIKSLEAFQNPNMKKILELCGRFRDDWRIEIESQTEGSLKDAIDGLVAIRHNIAHGRDTGISIVTVRDYYNRAKKVVALLEGKCLGE